MWASLHLQWQTDKGEYIQFYEIFCEFWYFILPAQIAACELLHALVLFILGRSAQPAMQKKVKVQYRYRHRLTWPHEWLIDLILSCLSWRQSPMTKLFRKVFPYLLQLGCDVEKVLHSCRVTSYFKFLFVTCVVCSGPKFCCKVIKSSHFFCDGNGSFYTHS